MIRYGIFSLLSALVLLFNAPASAQELVKIRVYSDTPNTKFYVDGTEYDTDATFNWPRGSKHILSCVQTGPPVNDITTLPVYVSGCSGFDDGGGGSGQAIEVQVHPGVTSYRTSATTLYRVVVNVMFGANEFPLTYGPSNAPGAQPPCGIPGDMPAGQFFSGVLFLGGECFGRSEFRYLPAGTVQLRAYAFPGFVFKGWTSNLALDDRFFQTYEIKGPVNIGAYFEKAKRARFVTDPIGFDVSVDGARVNTASQNPCRTDELLPFLIPVPIAGLTSLCKGDFDFAYDSKHVIGAPSPQQNRIGEYYVFDSWNIGGGQDTVYTPAQNNGMDTLVAKFVPGTRVTFLTSPVPLNLQVDNDPAPKSLTFIWANNSKHTVTAPPEQFDASGRKYAFKGWAHGGAGTQTITVDPNQFTGSGVGSGQRYTAIYELLPRATVQTTLPAANILVDGVECANPCTIDRPAGSSVQVSVPNSIPLNDVTRYDFYGWQDGGPKDRVVRFDKDLQSIKGNFVVMNKLTVLSDPVEGGTVDISPRSSDLFYSADSTVSLIATANDGYRFRRYEGDAQGTNRVGSVKLSSPRIVRAMFDKVPTLSKAAVRNAASDQVSTSVAPGSLVSIFGSTLAKEFIVGPNSPLAQTLGGTVVELNGRALPLIYVSPEQINAKLPDDLAPGSYTIVVKNDGLPDVSGPFTVVRNAPGLFINQIGTRGYALAFHEDGSLITPESPARRNEVVSVLGTGFGPYTQPVLEGFAVPDSPLVPLADPADVTVGGVKLQPTFAGAASGYVGVNVVRFRIAAELPRGTSADLRASANGQQTNVVLLPLE